ncbi:hypothetical protein PENTCL1PPCAC_17050, partial [Pristionchus entomophagus]
HHGGWGGGGWGGGSSLWNSGGGGWGGNGYYGNYGGGYQCTPYYDWTWRTWRQNCYWGIRPSLLQRL